MSEDFRDPFSEAELSRFLGAGESPAGVRLRDFTRALWTFFNGPANDQLGDARTIGFIVVAELEDTHGGRWLRTAMATGDGRTLPSWTARGYLADATSYVDKVYDVVSSGFETHEDEDDEG